MLMMSDVFVDYAIIVFFGLFAAILFDIATGWIKGFIKKDLNSVRNSQGYYKKLLILLIPFIGFGLDWLLAGGLTLLGYNTFTFMGFDIYGKPIIALFLMAWLILGELLSILENIGQSGVKMPKWISKRLTQIQDKLDDGDFKGRK